VPSTHFIFGLWFIPVGATLIVTMLYSIINPTRAELEPAYDPIKTHVFCTFKAGWLISLVIIQGICILGAVFFSWAHFHLHHIYHELISTGLLLVGAGFTIAVVVAADQRADYGLWIICLSQIISLAIPQFVLFLPLVWSITATVSSEFEVNLPQLPKAQPQEEETKPAPIDQSDTLDITAEPVLVVPVADPKRPVPPPETKATQEFLDTIKAKDDEIWKLQNKLRKRQNEIDSLTSQLHQFKVGFENL